jgi:alpha-1,6-mannosyltransferase
MTDPARRLSMLVAIGVLLVCLVACGLWLLDWQPVGMADATRLAVFVTSLCLAGALWLLAVAIVRSGRLPPHTIWLVLGIAAAMRLLTWTAPPILSSDMYRYVWDGRVQLAGINPYRYVPAADQLAFLRDAAVYPNINRAEYAHTVYPPVAQAIFALPDAIPRNC